MSNDNSFGSIAQPRVPGSESLVADGQTVEHTGTTDETVIKTLTIRGGTIGPNGILDIYYQYLLNGVAGQKDIRVRLGGIGGSIISSSDHGAATTGTKKTCTLCFNRNDDASQYSSMSQTTGADEAGTGSSSDFGRTLLATEDTSVDITLVLTVELADVTDSVDVRGWFVAVARGS